VRVVYVR